MPRCNACLRPVDESGETKCLDCLADAAAHDIPRLVQLLTKSRDAWRSRAMRAERITNEQCDQIFDLEQKLKGAA